MSSLGTFLSENHIPIVRVEKTNFPDGTSQDSPLAYIPREFLGLNPMNNRYRPKSPMSDEEHSKLLRQGNPEIHAALVKSMTDNPCFEAMKLLFKDGKFTIIDGHRRALAGADANRTDFLAIIYENLSEENFDYLAEWNEENPTKVPHDAFFKARGIAQPLIEAKSDAERSKIMERLKRRGISDNKAERAVDTFLYIQEFTKQTGEPEEKRADQYKAFETVALTRKEKFQGLRNVGEFEKIEALEGLGIEYLKANLAHDDIKVALDGLAKRDMADPLWQMIKDKEIDITKTAGLRKIVNEIRNSDTCKDLVAETKSFSQKIYGKLLTSPDLDVISKIRVEMESLVSKLDLFKASLEGVK